MELSLHPTQLARLKAFADVVEVSACDHRLLPNSEVAIIGSSTVDDSFMDIAGPHLKMVVRHGIGYDKVNVPAASARGVLAANTPNGPTEGTAEHAVGLMFAVAKGISRSDRALHNNGDWAGSKCRGFELFGRTLGVIGFGRIGQRVAEMCGAGIKMDVVYFDPFLPDGLDLPKSYRRVHSLESLLREADVVTAHSRLDPQSYRMIGEAQLRLMKPGAILINTSRGEVVDEHALCKVLSEGHLFGAGIDVFDPEPPSPENPLFQFENVVVTSHLASATVEASLRSSTGVVDQIEQLTRGERPTWLINPTVWPGRPTATPASEIRK
ncbi:MAG: hydroxyacid dehydrogenase [Devosia sp.]|uniref:hydroxyacid dehydrogenase n=1 Tax=Devosia sp. TaxID=1871048 RepID=UPI001AD2B34F|nr:hydroxyacid dehydrogenase [Devosia sp.]MBN9315660.1 hydroxyacid dehydrogenase [Devosia sp.]